MAKATCFRCNKLFHFQFDGPADEAEGEHVRVLLDGCRCCATGRLIHGQHFCLKCAAVMESSEVERLAKIDPRESLADSTDYAGVLAIMNGEVVRMPPTVTEDTFTDSDEWLARRSYEWELNIVMENESGNRRKEK